MFLRIKNNKMKVYLIFILIIFNSLQLLAQRREVRAVWITTALRLDFPTEQGIQAQRNEIQFFVDACRKANINTIVFQVSARGDAYYASNFLPWASNLTCFNPCVDPNNLGLNPGYNPLTEMINRAKQHNIEVHAWINTFFVLQDTLPAYLNVITFPPHPAIKDSAGKRYWKAEWFAKTQSGQMKSDGGFFFDPGNPAVRAHIANVATEIVKNYNVDGIHFDFIRHTDLGNEVLLYGDASNFWFANRTDSANGNPWNLNRNDFARLNIERLVKMVADSVRKYKPWVKVGATTPGVYTAAAMGLNCGVWELYSHLRSDPKAWAAKGYLDYHNPQVYWNMANCPEFTKVSSWWKNNLSGRQAWMGLAAYRIGEPNFGDFNEIRNQIIYTRLIGAAGVNFFRFRSMVSSINYLDSLAQDLFKFPANVPPMPWKDPVPPNPPTNLVVQKISANRYRLMWNKPDRASDGEVAEYYNIFRATQPIDQNNHTHLYRITASADTFFFDTVQDTNLVYYYAVSTLDKLDNESALSNVVTTNVEYDFVNMPQISILHQNYPNPFNGTTKIRYELFYPENVTLTIYDVLGRKVCDLVNEYQQSGKYEVEFNSSLYNISSGIYFYKLTTTGRSQIKSFVLIK